MTGEAEADRPSGGRRRSAARLAAVQALYQLELAHQPVDTVITEFVHHRLGRETEGESYGEPDTNFFIELVRGTAERRAEIDDLIAGALAPDWPLDRLETVLRALLRAGVYELLARPDIPARVAISEYLDVAHAFFTGKEPGLVNGVLDRLGRRLRAEELDGGARGGDAASR